MTTPLDVSERSFEAAVVASANEDEFDVPVPPSWQPTNLLEADAEPTRPPDRLGGTVYSDSVGIVSGEPAVGKSMLTMALAASEAIEGRRSLVVDLERTPGLLLERLRAAGLTDEQIALVSYVRPSEPADPEQVRAVVAASPAGIVVVDSYDAALALFGLEAKNEDIERFHGLLVAPLRATGAGVVLTDHLAKDREKRGNYSIGGQRKLARADWHLRLDVVYPLKRGATGTLKLRTLKDNFGYLPRPVAGQFELVSHPSTGALSWNVTTASDDPETFRPTVLMERASRYLERQAEPVSQRTVERDVQGNNAALRTALGVLVDEGYVETSEGQRGALLYRSLKPYREADE